MLKNVRSILTIFITLILVGAMAIPAFAQEGDPEGAVAAEGVVASEPFAGSGELAEGSATVAGPETTAPPVSGESASAESVIGADGRIKVNATTAYPNRAIAYLLITWQNNAQGSCTGWFIGPNDVATAAHCIFNTASGAAHGYAKSIVVYPGRNGASAPFGATTMKKKWVGPGWTTTGNPAYDYGVIQTTSALGNTVGWFGFRWQASNSFPGIYTIRGYPGDKPGGTMWTMNGAITGVNASRLWYSIDTFGGQSGSPVYHKFDGSDPGTTPECCYGIGFHTYGTSVPPNFGNSATRITQAVFNRLVSWKNAP